MNEGLDNDENDNKYWKRGGGECLKCIFYNKGFYLFIYLFCNSNNFKVIKNAKKIEEACNGMGRCYMYFMKIFSQIYMYISLESRILKRQLFCFLIFKSLLL